MTSFRILAVLTAIVAFSISMIELESIPPVWWDEGWTLSIARNWVELGHFGRLSVGQAAPPGLIQGYPVIGLVGLAFKYLGIGLFEARLVIVFYLVGALVLLLYVAYRFYNVRVAVITLAVLLLMSGNRNMHPLFMGRQVLGEVPVLFFLLAGFVCMLWVERSRIFICGSILFWSLAIITKAQVLPLWFVAVSIPIMIAAATRRWSVAKIFATTLVGSLALGLFWLFLATQYFPRLSPVDGLHLVIGVVLDPLRRVITLATTIQFGLPTLLGLIWALGQLRGARSWQSYYGMVKISFFILTGSWFAWWVLASTGWPRYLFPAAFLASIFVSAMLYEWTDGFRLRVVFRNVTAETRLRKIHLAAAFFLVSWACTQTAIDLSAAVVGGTNQPLLETVDYLNRETPVSAVIETYESELFFFLNRRYHYPPDQVHVELIRREDLGQSAAINYDPLTADPDYLVIGGWCRYYKCYESVLSHSNFKLVKAFGPYEVFHRVRKIAGN